MCHPARDVRQVADTRLEGLLSHRAVHPAVEDPEDHVVAVADDRWVVARPVDDLDDRQLAARVGRRELDQGKGVEPPARLPFLTVHHGAVMPFRVGACRRVPI